MLRTRTMLVLAALPLALAALPASRIAAQTPAPAPADVPPAPPAADTADVRSIDAILGALYDVISGPAGEKRDWKRMRSLFAPGARLIPTGARPTGGHGMRVLDIEGYISRSGPVLERDGFFEREVARRVEQYGNIAHAFSTYESRRTPGDATPFARGINSIQLVNDGTRWWVVTILWENESPATPLPAKYLTSADR